MVMLCSCTKIYVVNDKVNTYTDDEIFRGVFLFEGNIAKQIPSYQEVLSMQKDYDPNVREELEQIHDEIFLFINEKNPSFVAEFGDAIHSKNFFEIQKKLNEGGQLVKEALSSSKKYGDIYKEHSANVSNIISKREASSKEDFKNLADAYKLDLLNKKQSEGAMAVVVFVAVAAVVWEAAAIVNVVAAFTVGVWAYAVMANKPSDDLNQNLLIKDLMFIE